MEYSENSECLLLLLNNYEITDSLYSRLYCVHEIALRAVEDDDGEEEGY